MSNASSHSPLPGPRRVITGHTKEGKSTIIKDEVRQPFVITPEVLRHDVHVNNESTPKVDWEISNNGVWKDQSETMTPLFKKEGDVFTIVDYAPGAHTGLHRTISIDYAIVMNGSITLLLDDDVQVSLKPGDALVQRATMHGWKNESPDVVCRIAFIVLPAQAPIIDGEALVTSLPSSK